MNEDANASSALVASEFFTRKGEMCRVGDFDVFIAENYGPKVKAALRQGYYEETERAFVKQFVLPRDRVLEVGTALGLVAMTTAAIVGAENVRSNDANPNIVEDAKLNFARNGLPVDARFGALVNRSRYTPGEFADFGIAKEFWASRRPSSRDGGFTHIVSAPVFCLETEIAEFRASVLVCDIEGGEVELLRGSDLSGLRLIILETHYWAQGEAATDAMVRELILAGFSLNVMASKHGVLLLRRADGEATQASACPGTPIGSKFTGVRP